MRCSLPGSSNDREHASIFCSFFRVKFVGANMRRAILKKKTTPLLLMIILIQIINTFHDNKLLTDMEQFIRVNLD